jgi:hypothetical protein
MNAALTLTLLLGSGAAHAVPSFARQTGMPCAQCHSVAFGPALTAYGRQFKLNGYVWGEADHPLPLALMAQGGFTQTSRAPPEAPAAHFADNNNFSVDQVSLFYAGRLSSHVGLFAQFTYSGEDRHTSWDNFDLRYARPAKLGSEPAVIGVSLNNSPTVQDLWNSTPAWSFPFISSALAPAPAAAPLLSSGALAQTTIGATAYAMLNDRLYLEVGAYRGLSDRWLRNVGLDVENSANLDGLAPYWRAALQREHGRHYVSLGLLGLNARIKPDRASDQLDRYNDVGLDATYQYSDGSVHALTAYASLIREQRSLGASLASGASDSSSNELRALNVAVSYIHRQTWLAGAGIFEVRGDVDAALFAPAPTTGSANGSPDSRGYTLQAEWVPFGKLHSAGRPWLNLRLGLQYTGYERFNGGGANYDGFGRSAHDNDTLFGYFWIAL